MPEAPPIIRHLEAAESCCDPEWEAAYRRFESPEQEVDKFLGRLRRFGFDQLPRSSRVVELFCGRGGGLVALERLGFRDLQGVDLSEDLLRQYRGPATLHLADCRDLPFDDASLDIAIVQGGLHHLSHLPEDLDRTLAEVRRVLTPNGSFFAVEPWLTPFLQFVHTVVAKRWVRAIYARGDALAEMIDRERVTYEQWLNQPEAIVQLLHRHFTPIRQQTAWGKLCFEGKQPPHP